VIDLHSHLLPGLDDGPASLAESVELARELAAGGVRVVAVTPHVSARYPTTPARMRAALARVRTTLARAGVPLEAVAGGEVAVERLRDLDDEALRAFSLGGGGRFLLVEFPSDGWPPGLADRLAELAERGLDPVLAHPERNALVQAAPQRLAGLVEAGALVQLTASSLLARRGEQARTARTLLDSGLAHLVGGDLHRPGSRAGLAPALAGLPPGLARWLARDVPAALLAGERPPRRPLPRRRLPFPRNGTRAPAR
jgi:protein-tyrosine phosphatase